MRGNRGIFWRGPAGTELVVANVDSREPTLPALSPARTLRSGGRRFFHPRGFVRAGLFLFFALFLCGCGNANDATGRKMNKTSSTTSPQRDAINRRNSLTNAAVVFCRNNFSGPDAAFNQVMTGTILCPLEGSRPGTRGFVVRLKPGAHLPAQRRLCLIPVGQDIPQAPTCFTADGPTDVRLVTDQYTSLVVVDEGNIDAYTSFLRNAALPPPPRIFFTL